MDSFAAYFIMYNPQLESEWQDFYCAARYGKSLFYHAAPMSQTVYFLF